MSAGRISDILKIRPRFMRSTHLERDFFDTDALRGYVVTSSARASLERLARGLSPRSSQRAWRITGDYGTGKSSFALALSRLFAGYSDGLPTELRTAVNFRSLGLQRPALFPVVVTGSRAPIAGAILAALAEGIEDVCSRGPRPKLIEQLRAALKTDVRDATDSIVRRLLGDAAKYLRASGKAEGILLVVDELGKFLEYAAMHPERQDIYLLQELAETAARSGDTPIVVVGLLHQGFQAYAEELSLAAQKEWEKVAGRYDEILFDQPLEQTATLVSAALGVRKDLLPRGGVSLLQVDTARAVELGWYGPAAVRKSLVDAAASLYPLHPTTIPVLIKLFGRFGQNERSLYSFLLSDEPYALQSFASQSSAQIRLYRLADVYDYARAAFGHRLSLQSFRSHWNQIESVVESFPRGKTLELSILKTVAVLNLVDDPGLLATEESVTLAIAGANPESGRQVRKALKDLQNSKGVLYYRGAAGGYCLWPHTSVNLERAYQDALKSVAVPTRVGPLVKARLETRPLVARRHYIETGNLRHFRVDFVPPGELLEVLAQSDGADGRVCVVLCESQQERCEGIRLAQSAHLQDRQDVLVAVPEPLSGLSQLVAEVQRWEWITRNVPELNQDGYAQEEVASQLAACRQVLEKRVQAYVGLREFGETVGLHWYHQGSPALITSGKALLEKLSGICDRVYDQAPCLANELINRHTLSSAASAARLRLIERLFKASSMPLLGMDTGKKPPEMSMYLSVLLRAGLHREKDGHWEVAAPSPGQDDCRIRPVFAHLLDRLSAANGDRIRIPELFAELRRPPFGIRDGLMPLLLAVFAVIHEQEVAFYEQGAFLRQVTGHEFQRLIKSPETFEIQYCRVSGVRAAVFERLYQVLHPDSPGSEGVDVLDVVRPLCVFAAQLPAFTLKTACLTPTTIRVREALLRAEEPATLLFHHLPRACELEPFGDDEEPRPERVQLFVERLRASLGELKAAYPELLKKIKDCFIAVFERPGGFEVVRERVAAAAREVLVAVSEPRLKALCLRLVDSSLAEQDWLESLASLISSKPASKWIDRDEVGFREELGRLAQQFHRVESTVYVSNAKKYCQAMRVAITSRDGTEVEQVVYLDSAEEGRVAELETEILRLFGSDGRLGVLAATRAILGQLKRAK